MATAFCTCHGLVTCTEDINKRHKEDCQFRIAANLTIELPCEKHNLQACPECDPCTCGAGQTQGIL